MISIDTLLDGSESDQTVYHTAEAYYIDHEGDAETAAESDFSETVLDELAHCFTSPVQSFERGDGTYYGVIEYVEGDEWYGFVAHDQRSHGKRIIGIRDAAAASAEADLPHATAGDPSGSFADRPDADYDDLADALNTVYDAKYGTDRDPVSVDTSMAETTPPRDITSLTPFRI